MAPSSDEKAYCKVEEKFLKDLIKALKDEKRIDERINKHKKLSD